MTFDQLGLAPDLTRALAALGYATPTPIQAQAIPPVLEGRDLLGIAQTGTGKTAAFALPSLQRLAASRGPRSPRACRMLVLAPTRELASQIAESFEAYGRNLRLKVTTAFGGVPVGRQVRALEQGVDILVATPGRMLDLVDSRALNLGQVEILVLDEADQMLDLGFIHALKRVVQLVPRDRQTLFFSATMPTAIAELAARYLSDPVKVAVAPVASTAERVRQRVTFVNQSEKPALLALTLRDPAYERALVFTRTKHGADRVVRQLAAAGVASEAIHGNKRQAHRERALQAFKDGDVKVLVATDIAARGIDIDAVSHVINYELPNVPEQYVHRIGRTARAGAEGDALAFCAPDEKPYLKDIERLTRVALEPAPLPENFLALAAKLPKAAPAPRDAEHDARGFGGRHGHGGRDDAGHGAETGPAEARPHRAARAADAPGRPHGPRGDHAPRRDHAPRPAGDAPGHRRHGGPAGGEAHGAERASGDGRRLRGDHPHGAERAPGEGRRHGGAGRPGGPHRHGGGGRPGGHGGGRGRGPRGQHAQA
jgi:ATP-dependent RNA helicase RhlE